MAGGRPIILTKDRRPEFSAMYVTSGMTTSEIAAHFGVAQAMISKWAQRLGLPMRGKGHDPRPRDPAAHRKSVATRYAKYGPGAFNTVRLIGTPDYTTNTVSFGKPDRKPPVITDEWRAKITEANRRRWANPAYRAIHLAKLKESSQRRIAKFWAQIDDPEHYKKVRGALGAKAAREAFGISP